jgi:predicted ATPase
MSERFVLLSGCSGGGKSTLLAELRARGYHVIEEPGRRVVKRELASGGNALPWTDSAAFVRRIIKGCAFGLGGSARAAGMGLL